MNKLIQILATRNVGAIDRIARALPAVIVPLLWWKGLISGPLAVGFAIVAAMLLLTSITGTCSIYYMLGLSTCKKR